VNGDVDSNRGGGAFGGTFIECSFYDNSAYNAGGANMANLKNCVLSRNSAAWVAGGAASCVLSNCTVANNAAYQAVGGAADSTLYSCTVSGNRAEMQFCGGVGGCTVYDSVISDNYGRWGGRGCGGRRPVQLQTGWQLFDT